MTNRQTLLTIIRLLIFSFIGIYMIEHGHHIIGVASLLAASINVTLDISLFKKETNNGSTDNNSRRT